jgi:hypothetical protein
MGKTNSLREPISKIMRAKWTGSVAPVVEHLLCKPKALCSNPNPTKREKMNFKLNGIYLGSTWD